MAEKYETLIRWFEPEAAGGKEHKIGEVAEIDTARVFDLADLVRDGTVRKAVAAPASVPTVEETTPWQHLAQSVAAGQPRGVEGR